MTEVKDPFSWGKFIKGVFDPKLTAKLSAFALHIGLWVLLVVVLLWGFGKVKAHFFGSKAETSPVSVSENSGTIETGADKRNNQKFGVINF